MRKETVGDWLTFLSSQTARCEAVTVTGIKAGNEASGRLGPFHVTPGALPWCGACSPHAVINLRGPTSRPLLKMYFAVV